MDQMEIYWEVSALLISEITTVISTFLFIRFLKPFLNRSKYAWEAGCAYLAVIFTADFITVILYLFMGRESGGMFPDAVGLAAALAVMCLRDRDDLSGQYGVKGREEKRRHKKVRNPEQKIFLVVIMYLVEWFTHGIASLFREVLFRTILFSPAILNKPEMLYFGLSMTVEAVYLMVRSMIMLFLFHIIDKAYAYKMENISKKELGLLITIPLSVVAGYVSFSFFFDSYLSDMQKYIQDMHLEYDWIKALYQIVSFAAIISSIVLYQSIRKSHRQEKEEAVLEKQMESLRKHMEEVEVLYQDIRGLKHDMGNHVMVLESLCQKGRQQEAIGYLRNLQAEFYEIAQEVKTGNPITDVIIMEKEKEAKEKGIVFSCDFHYPSETEVNAFDISIILTNSVSNAIEGALACENPYIQIRSFQEKNAYMIEVRNNFTGELLLDEESGMPATTKENKEEHGCGLANIRKVARKYFGDIEVMQEEEEFILHVMLMLK